MNKNLPFERIAMLQTNLLAGLQSPTIKTYLQAVSLIEDYEQTFLSLNVKLNADEIKLFRDLVITPAFNEIEEKYVPNMTEEHDISSMYPPYSILTGKEVK